jgi:hypothetical protein
VTLDLDLSYSPDHIWKLLTKIRETSAKVVVASPYMKEGRVCNVPWLRRVLSILANRFLSMAAKGNLSTLTSMVRAYDGKFLRTLDLKSLGMEINPEVIYKTMLLQARLEEIPAHLNWEFQQAEGIKRRSSMRMLRHTLAVLISGFQFRPIVDSLKAIRGRSVIGPALKELLEATQTGDRKAQNQRSFGNLIARRFGEIWNGEPYFTFRKKMERGILPYECQHCPKYAGKPDREPVKIACVKA